ncbi:hypothetical protein ColTof4_01350 [Colletotrichum tofieldiae]|nr:hypothetical protein ColTof3_08604 [Colletotrichum tofieldiae]GKT68927.1 hypothetical protein ColTof4_01350 [Colletotrichum tofieldiae]GKT96786.1 hypothetical protein Ct61P_14636 [Colletotrichum tofieldiae]
MMRRRRRFSLKHPDALDLIQTVLRLNGVESTTLRVEYSPDQHRVWLKMTEGPVHRSLIQAFRAHVCVSAQKVLPPVTDTPGTVQIRGKNGHVGGYEPDSGWTVDRHQLTPHIVCEVAVSEPRASVEKKLEEYIVGSGGWVRAAIGIKVYTNNDSPRAYETILDKLHECDSAICTKEWTPLNKPDEYLCLHLSDFGDQASTSKRPLLAKSSGASERNDRCAPIRIAFAEILAQLRAAVGLATRERHREPPERLGEKPTEQHSALMSRNAESHERPAPQASRQQRRHRRAAKKKLQSAVHTPATS